MKKLFTLLVLSLLFVGCSDSDDNGLTSSERKAKTEELRRLEKKLTAVEQEIAQITDNLNGAQGGYMMVLREQLQNKMHERGELVRAIQRIRVELGLTSYNKPPTADQSEWRL